MKKAGIILIALLAVATLLSCSEKNPVNAPVVSEPRPITETEAKIIAAGNEFSWNLFREVVRSDAADPNKNIFISPLSASMALGMTYNGARNETQKAMQTTFGFSDLTVEEINQSYRYLIDYFAGLDQGVTFEIANSIWHADWFVVEPEFLDVNRTYFDAVVSALDFGSPEAVVTINNWVDDKTHGKIKTIISEIPRDAVMYLINALYFKGNWRYQFDPEKTRESDFYCADGTIHRSQFMLMQTDSLRFLFTREVHGVELAYGNGDYRFMAVRPASQFADIDSIIESLDSEMFTMWREGLGKKAADLVLPKFKLNYEIKLNDVLSDMGMGIAFSGLADFRGINRDGGLLISQVRQKTFVQLDEVGTEAAAATAVEIVRTSELIPSVVLNRPFVVLIYDDSSGAILFVGKIAKPEFDS